MHRIYSTAFAGVYRLYIAQGEEKTTFRDFFTVARLDPNAELITGQILRT